MNYLDKPCRADGNLTTDGKQTYTYDGENRLSTVTPRSLLTGSKKVEFSYDYLNRRVRKQVWAATVDGPFGGTVTWVPTEDRRFIYDGWNLLMELDGREEQTPPLTKFTWGLDLSGQNGNAPPWQGGVSESPAGLHGAGGIGGLLAMTDTKGTSTEADDGHLIHFYDANGNIGQAMDVKPTSAYYGQAVARYEYYPFGGILASAIIKSSSGPKNPFMFSTKYRDSETGLYYSGYRYLLPRLGRWLNRDPIGERAGQNLYRAMRNDPNNWLDPDGQQEVVVTRPIGPVAADSLGQARCVANCMLAGRSLDVCLGACKNTHDDNWIETFTCPGVSSPPASSGYCYCCALAEAARMYPVLALWGYKMGNDNEHGNAMKHCIWGCLTSGNCGVECARRHLQSREGNATRPTDCMDWLNNEASIQLGNGRWISPVECASRCQRALDDGLLYCIKTIGQRSYVVRCSELSTGTP